MVNIVVSGQVAPADPRLPQHDPIRQYTRFQHELGLWTPKRTLAIKRLRQSLLPAVKV